MAADVEIAAMHRALDLAARGPRSRNPQVGAVILSPTGEVLAEGWHRGAGTPHAEVDALSRLDSAAGATAVVTLEPCNHTGRTGPCAEALIAAGVSRVVYALTDPGEHEGGGAERLRAAGVDVEGGVLERDAHALLDPWLTARRLGRPHVTVKWAQSLDGRAAAADGTSKWITGSAARSDVHRRRAEADAIVVGTGTVLADDPELTARIATGGSTAPAPDRSAPRAPSATTAPEAVPSTAAPISDAPTSPAAAPQAPNATADDPARSSTGARGHASGLYPHQPVPVVIGTRATPDSARIRQHPHAPLFFPTHDLATVLDDLFNRGLHRVFVEGGPTLASAFIAADLADEVLAYIAPTLLGGPRTALTNLGVDGIAQQRRLTVAAVERHGDDLLVIASPTACLPPASSHDACHAAEPSDPDTVHSSPLTAESEIH